MVIQTALYISHNLRLYLAVDIFSYYYTKQELEMTA
jgi:hypothetical protein